MPLRMVGLVDLGNLADGAHFAANPLVENILQRFALPIGKDIALNLRNIFGAHLERVLRPHRQAFDLAIHPAQTRLGKDDACSNARRTVANDKFAWCDTNLYAAERFLQRKRAEQITRQVAVFAVDARDDLGLLDRHIAFFREHDFL
ncbi:hypothetical protein SDC9_152201 [bioreactor metagenome]|uniref:Uncharacterized protein n=1 Tax=bioreactor metagenome TaxID=1076179 RepID=A0A645EUQ0_9ZZZZ